MSPLRLWPFSDKSVCSINLRHECNCRMPSVLLLSPSALPSPTSWEGNVSVSPDSVREPLLTASHKMKPRLLSLTDATSPDRPCGPSSLVPCRPVQGAL